MFHSSFANITLGACYNNSIQFIYLYTVKNTIIYSKKVTMIKSVLNKITKFKKILEMPQGWACSDRVFNLTERIYGNHYSHPPTSSLDQKN